MNILHIIDTGGPGGAETIFLRLITTLDKKKFKSLAIIPKKDWLFQQIHAYGIDCKVIKADGSFNIRYLFTLVHIVRKYNISLIQCHLFGSAVYGSIVGLLCRVPVVSTFHGFVDIGKKEKFLNAKLRIVSFGSSRIIFVSERLRRFFIQYKAISEKKMEVVYNGVDINKFNNVKSESLRKELGLNKEDIIIGSVGNIRPAKGYNFLLMAAAELKKRNFNYKFVVVGEGSGYLYEDLLKLRRKMCLDDTVFFVGYKNDAYKLLCDFDVFLLPSISEGFSLVTIEAMASKIPVVVTKSGGPEEIVDNYVNGILVDKEDPLEIVSGIEKIVSGKVNTSQMVDYAYLTVKTTYSLDAMIKRYTEIYRKIKDQKS